ncbi:rho GTPase-activating protein 2-like [Bidens hawaiensis]|uniref:rho GTPase-activating protein 2-like n=1 Tax=Bidens hawaiensis TaxID=980011 RepID=UPI00404A5BB8
MTQMVAVTGCGGGNRRSDESQLSILELIIAAFRKSMAACRVDDRMDESKPKFRQMEIGWPTDVQHLTHVTFDRFHGFLGLPVEFQVEIPSRVPSASVSVFGVSAESMQCSYDSRGNSVPTILLLMQKRLYAQQGLKAEGIFRINPENSHEEHVRAQLNQGTVPEDIEVHCLASLIKTWFRELPCGVLDGLSPDEVLQCNTEEERVELVKKLRPTETALLNWAIDLMSDVAQHEELNKMNARNIAMVFAPNMTQMSDPLTALMHAVQVMNLLKTLITKTLREREETTAMRGPQTDNVGPDSDLNNREGMQTSSELGRPVSEDEGGCGRGDNSDNEVESLSEIEENFLKQIEKNKNAKRRFKKELNDLVMQHSSPTNGLDYKDGS